MKRVSSSYLLFLLVALIPSGVVRGQDEVLDPAAARRQVEDFRRNQGPEHPDTLNAMVILAQALFEQFDFQGALDLQEQVIEARERVLGTDHIDTWRTKSDLAKTLFWNLDQVSARELQQQVLDALERLLGGDHPDTLTAKLQYAQILGHEFELAPARDLQEQVVETRVRHLGSDHPETWTARSHLADTLRQQGDLAGARELYDQIIEARVRLLGSDHPDTWTARLELAGTFYKQWNLAGARDLLEQVVEARVRILGSDHPGVWQAKNDLASTLATEGDLRTADKIMKQVVDAFERILGSDHPHTLTARYNLAVTLWREGDLAAARQLYEQVIADYERSLGEDSRAVWFAKHSLALTLAAQGDLPGAYELFEQIHQANVRLLGRDHLETLTTVSKLAMTLRGQGELRAALKLQEQALHGFERLAGSDHMSTVNARYDLAEILLSLNKLNLAESLLRDVLSVRQEIAPESLATARILRHLGTIAARRGHLGVAEDYYQRSLAICNRQAPGSMDEALSLHALGDLLRKTDRTEGAATYFLRALDSLEAQIGRLSLSQDVKSSFRADYKDIYQGAIDVFLEQKDPDQALFALERYRARSFLELLQERDLVFTDIPLELDAARRRVHVLYDRNVRKLARLNPTEDAAIQALQSEQRSLHQERQAINAKIRKASPRLAALQDPQPLKLQEIQDTLDSGTVMVSYSVGEQQTTLFVATSDGALEVYSLAIGEEELRGLVEGLHEATHGRGWDRVAASRIALAKRLYVTLIEPVAETLQSRERLLVVPDGPLHLLPFAALIREMGDNEADSSRDWQYLVEWKPIHSVLSATVYAELKKNRRRPVPPEDGGAAVELAAFGDPAYPQQLGPEELGAIADLRLRSAARSGIFDWQPLPYTRLEVEQISGLYPMESVETFLGEEATEERAKSIGKNVSILHFATHSYLDKRLPLDSFLALTIPKDFPEDRDNGLLQVWEILESVRLDADLVVLSACESALGEDLGGEGLIGLTRAFQYAGARTVAATLWKVPDQTTAALMERFYRHLEAGKTKDEALRAAQIELIRDPIEVANKNGLVVDKDTSAPYYWAAFQIYGDWR